MNYFRCFTATFLISICYAQAFSQSDKPNIILIVADDLGWKDVGFMGSEFYKTPNLDKLAKQSMVFTNAYAAAANCAPSRACMLSGQNTPRHGIYTVGGADRGIKELRKLIAIKNTDILSDSFFTLPELLQKAGYYTVNIGKWHLGDNPKTQGFNTNIAGSMKGHPSSYFSPYKMENLADGPTGEYLTDRLTNEAVSFINNENNPPFFLYIPYYAVHTPLQAPQSLKEKYKNKGTSDGQHNSTYAAMIESLDTNIGTLMAKLDELDIAKNTIVIFTSDNGALRAISTQDPLRAGKGSYYEGGIRVPLIIKWPGHIIANTKSDVPVTNMDFYPTIMDILSIDKKNMTLDGSSILSVLKGGLLKERPLYWHFPIYLQPYHAGADDGRDPAFRTRPGAVIRLGDWKLHEYYEDGALELYNLKNDIGERNNVALANPDIVKKLHDNLLNWQKQVKAPIPTKLNPSFDPKFQNSTKAKSKKKHTSNSEED